MRLIAVAAATVVIGLAGSAAAAQDRDAARQTHCQALARVIYGDLNGQKIGLDSFRAAHPAPSAAEQAIIARKQAAYDADAKLFEALRAKYAGAAKPSPEEMAKLRNDTPYGQIKSEARTCL